MTGLQGSPNKLKIEEFEQTLAGVSPLKFSTPGSAPLWIKRRAASSLPRLQAQCKAVLKFWNIKQKKLGYVLN